MRWCFAVLGLLLLAACQQAPGTTTSQPASASLGQKHNDLPDDWSSTGGGEEESKYFKAEEEDLGKRIVAGLFGQCYGQVGDATAFDGCVRNGMVETFDDSGQGRQNCRALSDLGAFVDCIILGNAAVDMLHRMDSDLKIDAATWAGRRSFADVMGKVVVTSAIMACGNIKTEASASICIFDWYRKTLDVPAALADRCGADLSNYERGACLGEASIIRFMQDHVTRMPGIGI